MNLLPKTEKDNLKKGLKRRLLVESMFLLSASFLLGIIMLLPSYLLTLGNFPKTQLASLPLGGENENTTEEILNLPSQINSKLKFFQSNLMSLSASDLFYKVISISPNGIKLNSISFSRNQGYKEKSGTLILVSGIASSRETLVSFSSLLKKEKAFSLVDVPVSSLAKDKDLPFSINVFIAN